ncbi:MAG: hypothetical protein NTZ94_04165 [Verrucomicrobia bacterium]|nr:hypothetical protein [Verrucomicrobiota bacterium]
MAIAVLGTMAHGIVCAESTPNPALKNPIRFDIQELRETPVIDADHPDSKDNKYGFEGGSVVKLDGVYYLFTSEMAGDPFWVRMRLAIWTSPNGIEWKRVSTIKETSGKPRAETGLPYESFWSPMPIFNDADNRWELFHVAYDRGGATGGRIWRTTSTIQGRAGIVGPYKDVGIILQPDAESQKWEGRQGTASFFPYRVKDRWLAFYCSHGGAPGWQVGLAEAPALTGPWKRRVEGNPLPIEPVFNENPIVTRIGDLYVAVYDSDVVNPPKNTYYKEKTSVGYSTSTDGIHWAKGGRIVVQPPGSANWSVDIRTPLGLIDEGNDTFTLCYTAENKKRFWPVSMITLKLVKETQ